MQQHTQTLNLAQPQHFLRTSWHRKINSSSLPLTPTLVSLLKNLAKVSSVTVSPVWTVSQKTALNTNTFLIHLTRIQNKNIIPVVITLVPVVKMNQKTIVHHVCYRGNTNESRVLLVYGFQLHPHSKSRRNHCLHRGRHLAEDKYYKSRNLPIVHNQYIHVISKFPN